MKKLFSTLVVMAVITAAGFGQAPLTYSEVVQVDSVSKAELYNRAKIWFVTAYRNAKDVLQIDDKQEGMLMGKAIMEYNPSFLSGRETVRGIVKYTIKIFVKDGKYKYEVTDFIHESQSNGPNKLSMGLITTAEEYPNPMPMAKKWSNKVWDDIKAQIKDHVTLLITSLKQQMANATESKNDDW